ncbi:MAG: glutaredoxin family protein [Candidatus Paceibacterota bacterium]
MKHITIYSTPSCVYCKMAKAYFDQKGVTYTEKDVFADEKAREEMIQKSGQLGVPVIDIGGQIVIGFDKSIINNLLETK